MFLKFLSQYTTGIFVNIMSEYYKIKGKNNKVHESTGRRKKQKANLLDVSKKIFPVAPSFCKNFIAFIYLI